MQVVGPAVMPLVCSWLMRIFNPKSAGVTSNLPSGRTIARPGVLTNGRRSGRYRMILGEPSEGRNGIISRADVADFLVRQIEDRTWLRKAPVLVN